MSNRIIRRWAVMLFASCWLSSAAAATPQIVFGAETGATTHTTSTTSPNTLIAAGAGLTTGGPGLASSSVTLNDTRDTLISEGIKAEMIVRVEILLQEDGTWEVLSIVSLGEFTDVPGCATVTARVVRVNGKEVQLAGWPTISLEDDVKIENDHGDAVVLSQNQIVLVVICPEEDGQIRITHITVLNLSGDEIPAEGNGEKALICHKPNKKGGHTLSVATSAVPAHLGHGDTLGPCP